MPISISVPKLLLTCTVIFAVQLLFLSNGHASKFTHPLRAFVELSNVRLVASADSIKRKLRNSTYTWLEPSADEAGCVYIGKVSKLVHVVDSWHLVDLSQTFVGSSALVRGPCAMKIGTGSFTAEIGFRPKYEAKSGQKQLRIVGTSATGQIVHPGSVLRVSPGKDVEYRGYRFCLRNVTRASLNGTTLSVASFEIRFSEYPTTRKALSTLFYSAIGRTSKDLQEANSRNQPTPPFSVLLKDYHAVQDTLNYAEILVFRTYE